MFWNKDVWARIVDTVAILVELFLNASIFAVWLGLEWVAAEIRGFFIGLGVVPWCTDVFFYGSTVSTLVFALLCFLVQIKKKAAELVCVRRSR